jgi:acetyl esterase
MHGGGFVFGSLGMYDRVCGRLADECDAVVISIEYAHACAKRVYILMTTFSYQLSPEHKHPSAVIDCCTVVEQVVTQRADHIHYVYTTANTKGIWLMGDSAGGTLCVAVARHTRAAGVWVKVCLRRRLVGNASAGSTAHLPAHTIRRHAHAERAYVR